MGARSLSELTLDTFLPLRRMAAMAGYLWLDPLPYLMELMELTV